MAKNTKFKVIDNFLEKEAFQQIQSVFVNNFNFPWYYNDVVAKADEEFNLDRFQFTHILYRDNFGIASDFYQYITPLINKIDTPFVMRVKANLGTRTNEHLEGGFHTDTKLKHKTAVFYLNTNNGYTLFEDGSKVESIENRIVIFDSTVPHTGVSQTDTKIRCLLNINYL